MTASAIARAAVSALLVGVLATPKAVQAQEVNVEAPRVGTITKEQLESAIAQSELGKLLQFVSQRPNTLLLALVAPFTPSSGYSYDSVGVSMRFLVEGADGAFPDDQDVRILFTIPFQVDRPVQSTERTDWSLKLSTAASIISAAIGAGIATGEEYTKRYRTVTVQIHGDNEVSWDFEGLMDEEVRTGTYFVTAIVEVPASNPTRLVGFSGRCTALEEKLFGLSRTTQFCSAGPRNQWLGYVGPNGTSQDIRGVR